MSSHQSVQRVLRKSLCVVVGLLSLVAMSSEAQVTIKERVEILPSGGVLPTASDASCLYLNEYEITDLFFAVHPVWTHALERDTIMFGEVHEDTLVAREGLGGSTRGHSLRGPNITLATLFIFSSRVTRLPSRQAGLLVD